MKKKRTTNWSAPKQRHIRGEYRLVQTRYVDGYEELKIVESDLKKERQGELSKEIPFGKARKLFRSKSENPDLDQEHRAQHTYQRPNKRWAKNISHYDVETIDTPKKSSGDDK